MKWLIPRVVVLVLLLAAVGTIPLLVGRQQHLSPRVAILHFEVCKLPCWIGITPGVTTREEAVRILKNFYSGLPEYYILESDFVYSIYEKDTGHKLFSVMFTDPGVNNTAGEVTIGLFRGKHSETGEYIEDPTTPTIRELVAALGCPTFISAWPFDGANDPAIIYEHARLAIVIEGVMTIEGFEEIQRDWSLAVVNITMRGEQAWENARVFKDQVWAGFRGYTKVDEIAERAEDGSRLPIVMAGRRLCLG